MISAAGVPPAVAGATRARTRGQDAHSTAGGTPAPQRGSAQEGARLKIAGHFPGAHSGGDGRVDVETERRDGRASKPDVCATASAATPKGTDTYPQSLNRSLARSETVHAFAVRGSA